MTRWTKTYDYIPEVAAAKESLEEAEKAVNEALMRCNGAIIVANGDYDEAMKALKSAKEMRIQAEARLAQAIYRAETAAQDRVLR